MQVVRGCGVRLFMPLNTHLPSPFLAAIPVLQGAKGFEKKEETRREDCAKTEGKLRFCEPFLSVGSASAKVLFSIVDHGMALLLSFR